MTKDGDLESIQCLQDSCWSFLQCGHCWLPVGKHWVVLDLLIYFNRRYHVVLPTRVLGSVSFQSWSHWFLHSLILSLFCAHSLEVNTDSYVHFISLPLWESRHCIQFIYLSSTGTSAYCLSCVRALSQEPNFPTSLYLPNINPEVSILHTHTHTHTRVLCLHKPSSLFQSIPPSTPHTYPNIHTLLRLAADFPLTSVILLPTHSGHSLSYSSQA